MLLLEDITIDTLVIAYLSSGADLAEIAAGGNEVCQYTGGTTDVNYLDIDSSTTGNPVIVRAEGDDANVGLDLTTKADGAIRFNGMALAGHLWGLTLSNNATDAVNDLDIAVGEAISDDAAASSKHGMALTSSLVKQIDATWVVGTNQGMRDSADNLTGAKTFHIYLIKRTDTGVVDVFASTSTLPTLPTSYTKKRRIGSILWDGSTIRGFVQNGDDFHLKSPILDVDATNPGTAAVTRTLTVPTGIKVRALVHVSGTNPSNAFAVYLSDLDVTDTAPSLTAAPLGTILVSTTGVTSILGGQARVWTNTSGQIRSRLSASGASDVLRIAIVGWFDSRGKDA